MDRLEVNPNYVRFDVPNENYSTLNSNNRDLIETTINEYQQLNRNNNLPPDWIELIEPVTGKKYYACTTTKHTQWLNPTIPIGKIMPNGLPYGWEKEYDSVSKRYFYINHVGRFTTWNPPIKQRNYLGENYVW